MGLTYDESVLKRDRCCQCSQTENLHSYEGELYCQKHLNERLAQENL